MSDGRYILFSLVKLAAIIMVSVFFSLLAFRLAILFLLSQP